MPVIVKFDSVSSPTRTFHDLAHLLEEVGGAGSATWDSIAALNCSHLGLGELPAPLPTGLRILNCNVNRIQRLPDALPAGLRELHCRTNNLRALPALPAGLRVLDCAHNRLRALTSGSAALPRGLTHLFCDRNRSLAELPVSLSKCALEVLDCSETVVRRLPPLPASVLHIRCRRTQVEHIPSLVACTKLRELDCRRAALAALPALPDSTAFSRLDCAENMIRRIDFLPPWTVELVCNFNRLSALPALPEFLERLDCGDNRLESLPILAHTKLKVLRADMNYIKTLPPLPETLPADTRVTSRDGVAHAGGFTKTELP
jgi:Leucine-rich repeat (LRR) protein